MQVKLSDLCNITMGQSPKSIYYNKEGSGIPFMQGCTTFGRLFPSIDTWTTSYNKLANPNDILFTVRAPVGDINIALTNIAIGRGLAALKPTSVSTKYLYYLLLSNKELFTNNSSGTVYDSINKYNLENTILNVHSYSNQLLIVDIIGSLDDKIENNNKIIEKMNNLLNVKTNELLLYKTKKFQLNDIIEECKEKAEIELVPYSVINTGKVIIQNEQFNKEIAKNTKGKYKKIKKDYFVYNPSRINIGSIGVMEDEIGCVSPIYVVFKCIKEYKIYLQQLLTFDSMIKEINKRCSGSVRQALSFNDLCSIEIYDIEKEKLKIYNKYCDSIIRITKKLEQENKLLENQKKLYLAKFF